MSLLWSTRVDEIRLEGMWNGAQHGPASYAFTRRGQWSVNRKCIALIVVILHATAGVFCSWHWLRNSEISTRFDCFLNFFAVRLFSWIAPILRFFLVTFEFYSNFLLVRWKSVRYEKYAEMFWYFALTSVDPDSMSIKCDYRSISLRPLISGSLYIFG